MGSVERQGFGLCLGPASQDGSRVGHAEVGIVSLRGAPVALPPSATAQFRRFFDLGPAERCLLLVGGGRFMHLVVLYGYQGDGSAEQIALTEQLFDAALDELSVVARGQPCLIDGYFNVEPTKIPCLAKGISAGLSVDLEAAWALASGVQPAVTRKRTTGGRRRDFMAGCPLATAAVSLCRWSLIGGLFLILLLGLTLIVVL